jgi:hypothetical protein
VDEVRSHDVPVDHDHGSNTSSKVYESHKSLLLNKPVGHRERREGKTPTDRASRGHPEETRSDGLSFSFGVPGEGMNEGDNAENE